MYLLHIYILDFQDHKDSNYHWTFYHLPDWNHVYQIIQSGNGSINDTIEYTRYDLYTSTTFKVRVIYWGAPGSRDTRPEMFAGQSATRQGHFLILLIFLG